MERALRSFYDSGHRAERFDSYGRRTLPIRGGSTGSATP